MRFLMHPLFLWVKPFCHFEERSDEKSADIRTALLLYTDPSLTLRMTKREMAIGMPA